MSYDAAVQDRLYDRCATAISAAGREREALFLARLALLLFEQLSDEQRCITAIEQALEELPTPSLSATTSLD